MMNASSVATHQMLNRLVCRKVDGVRRSCVAIVNMRGT